MTESDDETPQLSSDTLSALKAFYTERDERQKAFEDLKASAEAEFDGSDGNAGGGPQLQYPLSMTTFTEDWNASQFWYDDATAVTLARQLLRDATVDTRIAVVSAPSVFLQIKNLLHEPSWAGQKPKVTLLEYDERFAVFGDEFVRYDFEHAIKLPPELKGAFDRIICDPPFLSEDCQTKAALTVRWLASTRTPLRLIQCTGERMETLIHRLHGKAGIRTTEFEIVHSKGLSNEFRCYANFECENWSFVKEN